MVTSTPKIVRLAINLAVHVLLLDFIGELGLLFALLLPTSDKSDLPWFYTQYFLSSRKKFNIFWCQDIFWGGAEGLALTLLKNTFTLNSRIFFYFLFSITFRSLQGLSLGRHLTVMVGLMLSAEEWRSEVCGLKTPLQWFYCCDSVTLRGNTYEPYFGSKS